MSLQVWMPLLGNLNNQGLYNPTITTISTQKFSTPGKIGASCYNAAATNSFKIPWEFDNDEISIAFWLKPTVTSDNSWTNVFGLGQFSNRLEVANANTSGEYYWYNSDNSNVTKVQLIGSGSGMGTITNNAWTHITVVISETEFKLYKNGTLSITKALSNKLSSIWGTQKYIWVMSSLTYQSRPFNGCMNDLRIYDHALSTREVKEIAKGLVCHYKLSPVGGENLLVNIPNWNPVSGQFGTFTKTYDTQERIFTITCSTVGSGVYSFPSCTLTANTTYTWSFYAKASSSFSLNKIGFENYSGYRSITFSTEWKKYSKTFTATDDSTSNPFIMYNGWVTGISLYIKDFKLEKGSKATPWCPNKTDSLYTTLGYNDNIEYDCSGYNNNGTKSGNITWSSDSYRYNGSYKLNGAQYLMFVNPINSSTTEFTISCWVKFDTVSGNAAVCTMRTSLGKGVALFKIDANFRLDDNTQATFSSYTVPANTWLHVVVTRNTSEKKLYVNGELKQTITVVGDMGGIHATGSIGASSASGSDFDNYIQGQLSDFRIYATALSADDVLQLYNTPICIDNHSNISAYDFIEGENVSFSKNGITTHKEFVDYESSGLTESTKMKIYKDNIVSNDFTEK